MNIYPKPNSYIVTSMQGRWIPKGNQIGYESFPERYTLNVLAIANIRKITKADRNIPGNADLNTFVAVDPDASSVIELRNGDKIFVREKYINTIRKRNENNSTAGFSNVERLMAEFCDYQESGRLYGHRSSSLEEFRSPEPSTSFWYYAKGLATRKNLIGLGVFTGLALSYVGVDVATSKLAANRPTSADFTAQIGDNSRPGPYDCLAAFSDQGLPSNVARLWAEIHKFVTGNPTGIMTPAQFETCRVQVVDNVTDNKQEGYRSKGDEAKDAQKLADTKAVGDYVAWGQKSQWYAVTLLHKLGL